MAIARIVAIALMVPGGILAVVGGTSPCTSSPVVGGVNWVPTCGDSLVIVTVGGFFLVAGALIFVAGLGKRQPTPTKRHLALPLGVSAVALVTAFATLTIVPLHQSFTMHDVAVYDLEMTCSGIDTVKGTSVHFQWWAASTISFGAWSCSANRIVYDESGTNGSGAFTSIGGVYEFGTVCPPVGPPPCVAANVSGTYTGPLLAL